MNKWINQTDHVLGNSALHWACLMKTPREVELLLFHHADVSVKNHNGWTALHFAAYRDTASIAQLLINHGADIEVQNAACQTPLHCAVKCGTLNVVEFLLKSGAEIFQKDLHYDTAMMLAKKRGFDDKITMLKKYATDISTTKYFQVQTKDGLVSQPLQILESKKHEGNFAIVYKVQFQEKVVHVCYLYNSYPKGLCIEADQYQRKRM